MSMIDTEVDERLYEMYVMYCRARGQTPSIKDYLVWKDEQGYDEDEPDWSGHGL